MSQTPETQAVAEMETPVEIAPEEMESVRYSYDLPQNSDAKAGKTDAVSENAPAGNNTDASHAPEQDSESEIPGDPRPPHQTQPPTAEQYLGGIHGISR